MKLREIIERCKALNIYEERSVADNYYEAVFYTRDNDQWIELFTEILGSVAKPVGTAPSKEDAELIQKHGGIREDQVLFKMELDNAIVAAMFWPWQDQVRTTLKIAFAKKLLS